MFDCQSGRLPDDKVIRLSSNSFNDQLHLVDPRVNCGKVVILVYRPGCPHCDIYHPTFVQAAQSNPDPNLRFAELNTTDNPDFLNRVKSAQGTIEFKIEGVPTVLGYEAGTFYSVYESSGPQYKFKFRSVEDTLEYGSGIGTAEIHYV